VHALVLENPTQNVFVEVLDPLEKCGAPLDTTWGLVKTLYLTNKDLMPVRAYVNIHNKARRSRALKFNSEPIYAACKVKYLFYSE
jgi:oligopeptidase A